MLRRTGWPGGSPEGTYFEDIQRAPFTDVADQGTGEPAARAESAIINTGRAYAVGHQPTWLCLSQVQQTNLIRPRQHVTLWQSLPCPSACHEDYQRPHPGDDPLAPEARPTTAAQSAREEDVRPQVTIGLPVYNGADHVERAITSVLTQTMEDFELVISDNCSTDATEELCRRYANLDPRVSYSRTDRNIGAADNFARVVHMASGEFFKWISHDDWIEPKFLETCTPLAASNQDIITVAPVVDVVNEDGVAVQSISSYTGVLDWSPSRLEQYRQMMDELAYCETHSDGLIMIAYVYGFHRLSLLRLTRLIMPFISSDYVLTAELALFGQLAKCDKSLSTFTLGDKMSGKEVPGRRWDTDAIQRMLSPSRTGGLDMLVSVRRRHLEHIRAVLRSPLSNREKLVAIEAASRPTRGRLVQRVQRRRSR
jgi:hypothetical protein